PGHRNMMTLQTDDGLREPIPKSAGSNHWLSLFCLLLGSFLPSAWAQTKTELNIQLHPALTISGTVGAVYSIEYVRDLSHTNAWHALEFVQLPATNYLWFDSSATTAAGRYYRAVLQVRSNMVFIPAGSFRMGS